jgi:hypothetical protein
MDQHQFDVRFRKCSHQHLPGLETYRVYNDLIHPFKLTHQGRHLHRSGEGKTVFTHIHLPIATSPFINIAEPYAVTVAEIFGRKPMGLTIGSNQKVHCPVKGSRLGLVHGVLGRIPQQVLEYQPIGAGLNWFSSRSAVS